MAFSEMAPSRHAHYGQHWGEGAARCFSIEGDFLDEDRAVRLQPVPDGFICPISAGIMVDPVATVDGCAYERESIEKWFRAKRQQGQSITSPITGLELPSATLMPLVALQRAIEAYMAHRPELKLAEMRGRSFEEAARILQTDLCEKQAMHASAQEELKRLRAANKTLRRLLREAEAALHDRRVTDTGGARGEAVRPHVAEVAGQGNAFSISARGVAMRGGGSWQDSGCGDDASPGVITAGGSNSSISEVGERTPHRSAPALDPTCCSNACWSGWCCWCFFTCASSAAYSSGPGGRGMGQGALVHAGTTPVLRSPSSAPGVGAKKARKRKKDTESGWCALALALVVLMSALLAGLAVQLFCDRIASPPPSQTSQWFVPSLEVASPPPPAPSARTPTASQDPKAQSATIVEESSPVASDSNFLAQVERLWSGSSEERRAAALRLRNLAAGDSENQAAIVEAGALAPLVQLLRDGEPGVREDAARALWSLARTNKEINKGNQLAIAQAGAISPLIWLLDDDEPRVRVVAAAVLNDLAMDNPHNQVEIARSGGTAPLIKLLKNDDGPSLVMASGLLQSLAAHNADKQVSLALVSAVEPLVELLHTGTWLAQEEAALTLGIFATCSPEIQVAIARAGAVEPLVARLKGDMMQGTAALALRNLAAGNPANQAAIAQAGAIDPLVRLLEDGMPGVREEAARALLNLSEGNLDVQLAIMRAEGVVPLADLLKGESREPLTARTRFPRWGSS